MKRIGEQILYGGTDPRRSVPYKKVNKNKLSISDGQVATNEYESPTIAYGRICYVKFKNRPFNGRFEVVIDMKFNSSELALMVIIWGLAPY